MSITATTKEQDIINALISIFAKATEPPTKEQVELKAKQLAPVFEYCEDLNNIVVETMISIDTKMGAGISLVENSKHDDQWVNKREEIKWIYTKRRRLING